MGPLAENMRTEKDQAMAAAKKALRRKEQANTAKVLTYYVLCEDSKVLTMSPPTDFATHDEEGTTKEGTVKKEGGRRKKEECQRTGRKTKQEGKKEEGRQNEEDKFLPRRKIDEAASRIFSVTLNVDCPTRAVEKE